jgi:hypothetical protein
MRKTRERIFKQKMYNLADIIRFNHKKGLSFKKESIAYRYISRMNPLDLSNEHDIYNKNFKCPDIDFDLLYEITERENARTLQEDTFAIHIRAGDCIDLYQSEFPTIKKFIEIIKKYNLHKEYRNCALVTGNHNNHSVLSSDIYIKNLKSRIQDLDLTCEIISSTVDKDFVLLAKAKCFLVGFRGFSWLAASINRNRTIWDIQNPPRFNWLHDQRFKNQLISGYNFNKKNKE